MTSIPEVVAVIGDCPIKEEPFLITAFIPGNFKDHPPEAMIDVIRAMEDEITRAQELGVTGWRVKKTTLAELEEQDLAEFCLVQASISPLTSET